MITKIKSGFGYDIHRLIEGEYLLLAGVKVDCDLLIDSHSDGDIVLHALSNAILSTLGKEDIGFFFPDNKEETLNISSVEILNFALRNLKEKNYKLSNVVVDIVLEKPKLKDYRENIKKNLQSLLNLDQDDIAVHFNTNEKVDSVGLSKAIVVYCNVLVYRE